MKCIKNMGFYSEVFFLTFEGHLLNTSIYLAVINVKLKLCIKKSLHSFMSFYNFKCWDFPLVI